MADTATAEQSDAVEWDGENLADALAYELAGKPWVPGDTQQSADPPPAGTRTQSRGDGQPGERDPDGVLTADGRHVLPFDVLRGTREQLQEARRREAELAAENERLRNAQSRPGGGSPTNGSEPAADALPELSDDELEFLKEDDPRQYQLYMGAKALQDENRRLKTEAEPLLEERQRQEQAEKERIGRETQEAIESTPELRWLQDQMAAGNQDAARLWNEAVANDEALKAMPRWQGKPMAERFAAVVREVEAVSGKFNLPPEYRRTAQAQREETPREKAARVIHAAQNGPGRTPTRLSDLEGGAAPGAARNRVADMSHAELLDQYLADLARGQEHEFDKLLYASD